MQPSPNSTQPAAHTSTQLLLSAEFRTQWIAELEAAHTIYTPQAEANSKFSPLPVALHVPFNLELSDENATAIMALLSAQNSKNWNLGMLIARCQDAVTTQQYIQLLSNLIQSSVPAGEIIKLLNLQNMDGKTFGMLAAGHQNATTVQQYIQLLLDLIQNGISTVEIIKLLNLQNMDGRTFGILAAEYRDATTVQQYIQLLLDLMQNGISAVEIIKLLKLQTENGWTFGMVLANNQDSETTIRYVFLLIDLMQDGKFSEEVFELICLTDKNNQSIRGQKEVEIAAFLYLISNLAQHGISESRIKKFLNFRILTRRQDVAINVNGYVDFVTDENGKRVAKLIDAFEYGAREGVDFLVESANQAITFLATTKAAPIVSASQAVVNQAATLASSVFKDSELEAAAPYTPRTYRQGKCKLS